MVVRLVSFKKNDSNSNFLNASENTYTILNAGETLENILEYTFYISGLRELTIDSIKFDSIFSTSGNFMFGLKKDDTTYQSLTKNINTTNYNIEFISNLGEEVNDSSTFILTITNRGNSECEYGLQGFTISIGLQDYKVSFSGPLTGRNASSITCSVLVLNKGVEAVTFSKDPTKDFNSETDNIQGKAYFRKNGIFVDNYQYGVNAPATSSNFGIVKLSEASFKIDENDGGIIAPSEVGVAATPQLVYNSLATAKQYVDDSLEPVNTAIEGIQATLDGIDAPLIMNIEDEENNVSGLGDTLTFSSDFEQVDSKLYIKWLELI